MYYIVILCSACRENYNLLTRTLLAKELSEADGISLSCWTMIEHGVWDLTDGNERDSLRTSAMSLSQSDETSP